jgi:hypothetical protein
MLESIFCIELLTAGLSPATTHPLAFLAWGTLVGKVADNEKNTVISIRSGSPGRIRTSDQPVNSRRCTHRTYHEHRPRDIYTFPCFNRTTSAAGRPAIAAAMRSPT